MMRWRKACAQNLDADRMGQSGNLKWIVCLPYGEILPLGIAISERCTRRSSWRSSLTFAESSKTARSAKAMYVNFPLTLRYGEIYGQ